MKRKVIAAVCFPAFLAVILGALTVQRSYTLLRDYPNPSVNSYKMGAAIPAGSVSITVTDFKIVDAKILMKQVPQYANTMKEVIANNGEISPQKVALVKTTIRNESAEAKIVHLEMVQLESRSWGNGIEPFTFESINNSNGVAVKVPPGKTETYQLSYQLFDFQFYSKQAWDSVEKRPFDLVLSTYPVMNIVSLQD